MSEGERERDEGPAVPASTPPTPREAGPASCRPSPCPRGGRGPWRLLGSRFRSHRASVAALGFVLGLAGVAILAPVIVGTRPIVCRYRGAIYVPCLEYCWKGALNPVFRKDGFRDEAFPASLARLDPESWALWPLVYQDPYRRVGSGELPGDPGNGSNQPPSRRNLFGTDDLGRDIFARVVYGTRVALLVGFVSMGIAAVIGILAGSLAGYFGGATDMVISRAIEVMMSIPTLVLILALLSVIERPTVLHLMVLIGLTRWESIARYTRGEFLRLRESDFVVAARCLGAPWHSIVFRHILPNALAPAIVTITFGIANAILLESGLSFLGFGAPPPAPSWGGILALWLQSRTSWWLVAFPGLSIFAAVLSYNLVGEGLQEAANPRTGKGEA